MGRGILKTVPPNRYARVRLTMPCIRQATEGTTKAPREYAPYRTLCKIAETKTHEHTLLPSSPRSIDSASHLMSVYAARTLVVLQGAQRFLITYCTRSGNNRRHMKWTGSIVIKSPIKSGTAMYFDAHVALLAKKSESFLLLQ